MTHTYKITGMTCANCETNVRNSLLVLPEITDVKVSKESASAIITMTKHVSLSELQKALGGENAKYKISAPNHSEAVEKTVSWFETYKPILLIFTYITLVSLLTQVGNVQFMGMHWMRHFMSGFFFVFSFFKLLNLSGFAESYVMYDVLAKRIPAWSYIYAFTELALGIAYLIDFNPLVTSSVTLLVMTISIIGVLQSVMNKRKIQCACLGAVFNLPMSSVTIIEDGLMIGMSIIMIALVL